MMLTETFIQYYATMIKVVFLFYLTRALFSSDTYMVVVWSLNYDVWYSNGYNTNTTVQLTIEPYACILL